MPKTLLLILCGLAVLAGTSCGSRSFSRSEAPSFTFPTKDVSVAVRDIDKKGKSRLIVEFEVTNNTNQKVFLPFLGNGLDFSSYGAGVGGVESLKINPDARIGPVAVLLGYDDPNKHPYLGVPKHKSGYGAYGSVMRTIGKVEMAQRAAYGGYKISPNDTETIELNFNWPNGDVRARQEKLYFHILGMFDEQKKVYGGGFIAIDITEAEAIAASKKHKIGGSLHKANPNYK